MSPKETPQSDALADLKRYVRVRRVDEGKFVEFDFAIGDPSLYVELVLPPDAFHEFCRHNRVEMMSDAQAQAVDEDMEKWRYGFDLLNPSSKSTR